MKKDSKIYLAGHTGMVGSAVLSGLRRKGYENIVFQNMSELDLRQQQDVFDWLEKEKPEAVIIAAAKVGGILANDTYRAEFIYDNLMIESNLIHGSYISGVSKLVFLGSSCIYPKFAPQPMKEEYLLSGFLESTNEPYAIAKIAGIKLCENYYRQYGADFISLMPTNLYGPNDNFHLTNSHVIPALIRKFISARNTGSDFVEIWGTGKPKREFLFVEDLAEAVIFAMEKIDANTLYGAGISQINIGTGKDISIAELAETIAGISGFKGKILFDTTKPDGTPRKLLDVTRMSSFGWKYSKELEDGLRSTIEWYQKNKGDRS